VSWWVVTTNRELSGLEVTVARISGGSSEICSGPKSLEGGNAPGCDSAMEQHTESSDTCCPQ